MSYTKRIGAVSAYAMAKDRGYEGTEDDFVKDLLDKAEAHDAIKKEIVNAKNEIIAERSRLDNYIAGNQNETYTTLAEGTYSDVDTVITLSDNINHYDFLDIYIQGAASSNDGFARRIEAKTGNYAFTSNNIPDSDEQAKPSIKSAEIKLSINSTSAKITLNHAVTATSKPSGTLPPVFEGVDWEITGNVCKVKKIVGVKQVQQPNGEITDARVGVDGTVFDTLGQAIREQFKGQENRLMEIELFYPYKNICGQEFGVFYEIPSGLIKEGTTLTLSTENGENVTEYTPLNFYDKDKKLLAYIGLQPNTSERTYTCGSEFNGSVYANWGISSSSVRLQAEIGSKKTTYQPYIPSWKNGYNAIQHDKEELYKTSFPVTERFANNIVKSGIEGNYNCLSGIKLYKGKTYKITTVPSDNVSFIIAVYLYDSTDTKIFNQYIIDSTSKTWTKGDKKTFYFTPTIDYENVKLGNYYREVSNGATITNSIDVCISDDQIYDGTISPSKIKDLSDDQVRNLLDKKNSIQFFTDNYADVIIEGDWTDGKVYFSAPNLYVRGRLSKNYKMSDISNDTGVSLVESHKGTQNCLPMPNTTVLAFDVTTEKFAIKSRDTINKNHIVIIAGTSGKIIYVHPNLINPWNNNERLNNLENSSKPSDIYKYYGNNKSFYNVAKNSDFKFIHLTDLHSARDNMHRIITFANGIGANYINAIINSGDTVARWLEDGLEWYNSEVDNSNIDILTCIGNHDAWSGNYFVKANAVDIYNAEIAPMISKVQNIVQPNGASTNGYNYYYKDYNDIRIIVVDAMDKDPSVKFWDNAEKLWFENVLNDANSKNKYVICVTHAPFEKALSDRDDSICWNTWFDYRTSSKADDISLVNDAIVAVNNFMENGGKFICWLSGHEHCDNILTHKTYPNQMMISMASSAHFNHGDGATSSNNNSGYYDCFNYCGVDLENGFLKVWRIGWNMDASMKVRNNLCYDFKNHKIVSSN